MTTPWLTNPVFWIAALPALAISGLFFQMILSLFTCCGTFRFRGQAVSLKWWMLPTTGLVCVALWSIAIIVVILS